MQTIEKDYETIMGEKGKQYETIKRYRSMMNETLSKERINALKIDSQL
jgi:hypothetical protein